MKLKEKKKKSVGKVILPTFFFPKIQGSEGEHSTPVGSDLSLLKEPDHDKVPPADAGPLVQYLRTGTFSGVPSMTQWLRSRGRRGALDCSTRGFYCKEEQVWHKTEVARHIMAFMNDRV
jgi:hypothetical protein